jgi:hypothetical protein
MDFDGFRHQISEAWHLHLHNDDFDRELTPKCALQHNDSGLLNVMIEEVEVNDVVC